MPTYHSGSTQRRRRIGKQPHSKGRSPIMPMRCGAPNEVNLEPQARSPARFRQLRPRHVSCWPIAAWSPVGSLPLLTGADISRVDLRANEVAATRADEADRAYNLYRLTTTYNNSRNSSSDSPASLIIFFTSHRGNSRGWTGTVTIRSVIGFSKIRWLPAWRTHSNPTFSSARINSCGRTPGNRASIATRSSASAR